MKKLIRQHLGLVLALVAVLIYSAVYGVLRNREFIIAIEDRSFCAD